MEHPAMKKVEFLAISSQLSSGSNFFDKDRERRLYACLLLLQQLPFERWRDENVKSGFVILEAQTKKAAGYDYYQPPSFYSEIN
jgi:hypothetical protein